jgi:hypothetical protein
MSPEIDPAPPRASADLAMDDRLSVDLLRAMLQKLPL